MRFFVDGTADRAAIVFQCDREDAPVVSKSAAEKRGTMVSVCGIVPLADMCRDASSMR